VRRRCWICCALFFLLTPSAALADRLIQPGGLIREVTSRVRDVQVATAHRVRDESPASLSRSPAALPPKRAGVRSALGRLVVTRDLQIPGVTFLAFRPLPTSKALGGERSVPFVFKFAIETQRVGVDLGGRF
jgi:hypothetical protein